MHRQPSSRNFAYHFLILLKSVAAFWNSARNCLCTVATDEILTIPKHKVIVKVNESHIYYFCLLAVNQGNFVHGVSFLKNLESFSLYQCNNTMIRCVVYLLRIFKMFHGRKTVLKTIEPNQTNENYPTSPQLQPAVPPRIWGCLCDPPCISAVNQYLKILATCFCSKKPSSGQNIKNQGTIKVCTVWYSISFKLLVHLRYVADIRGPSQ
jgi:hypothetical protein